MESRGFDREGVSTCREREREREGGRAGGRECVREEQSVRRSKQTINRAKKRTPSKYIPEGIVREREQFYT
jgi:hypothetical protein